MLKADRVLPAGWPAMMSKQGKIGKKSYRQLFQSTT